MAAEEEKKPADVKPSQAVITLKVKDQGGQETIFKVKRHTKMKKVFAAYASRKGIRVESLRFVLDGDRISPDQTPESLELEDEDQIDAVLFQEGGSARAF